VVSGGSAGRAPATRVRFLRRRPSGDVPLRRREVELCVERPLMPGGSGAGTVRLSARFDVAADEGSPSPADLAQALDRLTADLNALVGPPLAAAPVARTDRELTELVETYRPRQRELVDLLLADGEISPAEHARLVEYVASARPPRAKPAAPAAVPETERLLATVPIDRGRLPSSAPGARSPETKSLESARPVPVLLETYQITSLRQAGAVRGRRQISFAEYMALKRHFEEAEARSSTGAARPPG